MLSTTANTISKYKVRHALDTTNLGRAVVHASCRSLQLVRKCATNTANASSCCRFHGFLVDGGDTACNSDNVLKHVIIGNELKPGHITSCAKQAAKRCTANVKQTDALGERSANNCKTRKSKGTQTDFLSSKSTACCLASVQAATKSSAMSPETARANAGRPRTAFVAGRNATNESARVFKNPSSSIIAVNSSRTTVRTASVLSGSSSDFPVVARASGVRCSNDAELRATAIVVAPRLEEKGRGVDAVRTRHEPAKAKVKCK